MRLLAIGVLVGAFAAAVGLRFLSPPALPAPLRRTAREDDDLESLTRDELYERAKERDIPGRGNMTKAQLIDALRAAES